MFNAWKRISVTEKVKKEQERNSNLIKIENAKYVKATNFYNTKILEK